MSNSCVNSPNNKREYISDIGEILVKDYGKKKYYKPKEVKEAHKKSNWVEVLDFSCWAMSTFSSHTDFDKYHESVGEVCDYVKMKAEMLNGISTSSISNWTEIPDLDFDSSWLDFGDVFEGVFEGIGDVVGGIFDGLS